MINLIKNELFKFVKKKSFLIILIISIIIILLNNILCKVISNESILENTFDNIYIEEIKEEIKNIDLNSDPDTYYSLKSEIDTYELVKKYPDRWKKYLIETELSPIIGDMYICKYIDIDNERYKSLEKEYNNIINILDNGDWKDYTKERIIELQKMKENLENELKNIDLSKNEINELTDELIYVKNQIYINDIRLKKNIPYDNNNINIALNLYNPNIQSYEEFENDQKETLKNDFNEYETKVEYISSRQENEKYKYMIDNNIDIDSSDSLRNSIVSFFDDYSIIIIVISLMISGSIISSEFDKGTIKLLLLRPFKRSKILLSKYISSIIVTLVSIIMLFIISVLIGICFYGTSSLKIPVIIYNFKTDSVMYINIFKYFINNFITILPKYIVLATLAFSLSTIINNTAVSIIVPIIINTFSSVVNALITAFNLNKLYFIITLHWDLSKYLYGGIGLYNNSNIFISIILCLIYLTIMMIPTFIVFNRRNIKNI